MLSNIARKLFGSRNDRAIKRLRKSVTMINNLEASFEALSDDALRGKTAEFKERLAAGTTLKQLLPEAFAAVRETSKRTLGMRHYDVQLVGGMVLHGGNIAEMLTGEGKTLVATLPAYLNALSGKGVFIVTVNDYLARRDAAWMAPIYEFLGLTVAVNATGMTPEEKKAAYQADIIYGTNNEFGFDYLRDNMAFSLEERVQRHLHFAIVDEVDSILIDEARTPLIISGMMEDSSELYQAVDKLMPKLQKGADELSEEDFYLDEKARQVYLTEAGHERCEKYLTEMGLLGENESLYDAANINLMHHISAALRAHFLYQKDVDYIIQEGKVVIVDEHTGRTMPGRRWSEGLHQAVEAKENVAIAHENQTLASVTFQNYFRLFSKLSGMTGTADTEAYEFQQIYGLEVLVVPPNKPVARVDQADLVYLTVKEKYAAIVEDIKERAAKGQPVLVGTVSIEISEYVAKQLRAAGIEHEILNAKQHEREAHIIVQAGRPGAVTIATNMAGRGTDIVLGGNLEAELEGVEDPDDIESVKQAWQKRHDVVIELGGLYVLGTERHESRRIDNQLRGRAGRQGDPGETRFYLSLEDDLLRIFASPRMMSVLQKVGMGEDEAIESKMLSRSIENAQRRVEGRNFDVRKQLLEYDNVANDQRQTIYEQRYALLQSEDVSETAQNILSDVIDSVISLHVPPGSLEEIWESEALEEQLREDFVLQIPVVDWLKNDENLFEETLRSRIINQVHEHYNEKEAKAGSETMRAFERALILQFLDKHWREHLSAMDHLRQGIHLRSYAAKNPKQEFKREAFSLFSNMLDQFKYDVASMLCRVQVQAESDVAEIEEQRRREAAIKMNYQGAQFGSTGVGGAEAAVPEAGPVPGEEGKPFVRETRKIGRNEPCHCGSGKKFKNCHGAL